MLRPRILSASRATDIPAFFGAWLLERLESGSLVWRNPFNGRLHEVSFERARAIVLWTKNPAPFMEMGALAALERLNYRFYFHYTLNDYEAEALEPGVPPLKARLETFKRLSEAVGPERVIWRSDPLLMLPGGGCEELLERIFRISRELCGFSTQLIFSFVDVAAYKKVKAHLARSGLFAHADVERAEPQAAEMRVLAQGLAGIRDYWHERGWDLRLSSCAERMDLSEFGISHARCIDPELLAHLCADTGGLQGLVEDAAYRRYIKARAQDAPGAYAVLKDRGQRACCGCMVSKDIGRYGTCRHGCAYCYAGCGTGEIKASRRGPPEMPAPAP